VSSGFSVSSVAARSPRSIGLRRRFFFAGAPAQSLARAFVFAGSGISRIEHATSSVEPASSLSGVHALEGTLVLDAVPNCLKEAFTGGSGFHGIDDGAHAGELLIELAALHARPHIRRGGEGRLRQT